MKPRKRSYIYLAVLCIIFAASVAVLHYRLNILLLDASRKGDTNIAVWLIRLGANPNYVRYLGGTCSEAPLSVCLKHLDTLQALIDNGADVNLPIEEGHPALLLAAQSGYNDAINLLLENGASFSDSWGDTALIMAASSRRNDTMRLLVDKGDDVNAANESGLTALYYCAVYGNNKGINLLLENGADINALQGGDTALMLAASRGHMDTVEFLVDKGAKLGIRNKSGLAAVNIARREGHKDMVGFLLKAGSPPFQQSRELNEELLNAAIYEKEEEAEQAIAMGADLNFRDN